MLIAGRAYRPGFHWAVVDADMIGNAASLHRLDRAASLAGGNANITFH
jgi:hypothetical protein